jgi:hypothetical protein
MQRLEEFRDFPNFLGINYEKSFSQALGISQMFTFAGLNSTEISAQTPCSSHFSEGI